MKSIATCLIIFSVFVSTVSTVNAQDTQSNIKNFEIAFTQGYREALIEINSKNDYKLSDEQWQEVAWTSSQLASVLAIGANPVGMLREGITYAELSIALGKARFKAIENIKDCLWTYGVESVSNGYSTIQEAIDEVNVSCGGYLGGGDELKVNMSYFLMPFAPNGCNDAYLYTTISWWDCFFNDHCGDDIEVVDIMCARGACAESSRCQ